MLGVEGQLGVEWWVLGVDE